MSRIFDVIQALSGQKNVIVIPAPYLDFFKGDQQAHMLAAILNQLVYWSGIPSSLSDGWFYKSYDELAGEIRGVTADQVRKATSKLISNYLPGVIETATRKVSGTPKKHYRLDGDVLIAKIFPPSVEVAVLPNGNGGIAESIRQKSQMETAEKPNGNGDVAESYLYTDHYLQINKPSSLQNSDESGNKAKSDFLSTHPDAAIYTPSGKSWGTAKDLDAAKWIFAKIRIVNAAAKEPNWVEWSNDVRLMHEQDDRSHREICELFKWANTDSFWAANILSPRKLRVKWDELVMRSQAKVAVAPVIDNSERDSAYKRFISGTGQDVKRSELEIKVGLEASKVGVRSMGASFAVVRWNALWKECSQRVSGEVAA
ncbi:hypothetical protein BF17_14315 [Yersinia similis]|uniref:Uncharacterized protein n=1 Tax=Yersinia similis TaxID=367190 RepID=A0ABM5PZB7_9GAMM|nr:hypothetical protein [Yersinia similis]AHK20351.1 hypothetical protein BF17_14315 [Yersinia similis]CFQ72511.1 Uncharacterised protein [Yersinia similis]